MQRESYRAIEEEKRENKEGMENKLQRRGKTYRVVQEKNYKERKLDNIENKSRAREKNTEQL